MPFRERWVHQLSSLQERYGQRRVNMLGFLVIIGIASLVIQILLSSHYSTSAFLYIGVPYAVAVAITLLRPYDERKDLWQTYGSHCVSALVVFFASSVILREGFICILFFIPIYMLMVSVVFLFDWLDTKYTGNNSNARSITVPLLILLLSAEGATELTSFERHNVAVASATTNLTPAEVLNNLSSPFDVVSSDNWMLGVFPMPVAIEAGSLNAGDIHRVHTRYHRWFFTNTHEGQIDMRIDSVNPDRVTASFIGDTSYFSNYIRLIGSEISITTDANLRTRVTLKIEYERRLDPAWYFQPIQQYAMSAMAKHLIAEVMTHE